MKKITRLIRSESRKLFRIFSHPTFLYLTIVGNLLLIVLTVIVYHLEKGEPNAQIKTYFDALWWGISTLTTVGYGDLLPQTAAGRIIGITLMYTGTALFMSFTGVLMMILMKDEVEEEMAPIRKEMREEEEGQLRMEKMLQEMELRLARIEKEIKK